MKARKLNAPWKKFYNKELKYYFVGDTLITLVKH